MIFSEMIPNIPVLVINRHRDTKKWKTVNKQLAKIGMNRIYRIIAYEGEDAFSNMHQYFTATVYKNIIRGPFNTNILSTWNAAAYALSHYKAMYRALQLYPMVNVVIICEDDICILNEDLLKFFLMEAYNHVYYNKSICFFNSQIKNSNYPYHIYNKSFGDTNSFQPIRENLFNMEDCLVGSHFYMSSVTTIMSILPQLFPITFQIDIHLSRVIRKKCDIQILFVNDCGLKQDTSQSCVQFYNLRDKYELWEICRLKIPLEICHSIFEFIPLVKLENTYEMFF
jgi:GR25 family glycosyltransferase involved in LPS biosynthesis